MSDLFAVPKIASYCKAFHKLPAKLTEKLATFLQFTSVFSLHAVRRT